MATIATPTWVREFPRVPEWKVDDVPKFLYAKRDGHRLTVIKHESGRVQCLTRTPTDITEKLNRMPWMTVIHERVPPGTALVGELWCPGVDSSQIKTAINENWPKLKWDAFAILGMRGWNQLDLFDLSCEDVTETLITWGVPHIGYQRPFRDECYDPDLLLHRMKRQELAFADVEGFVLRSQNLGDMTKWKPNHTMDLIVSGLTEGEGKYLGLAGALECKTIEGYPVARCSGMTDDVRVDIDESWIGRVVEVKYTTVTHLGRLRHPRFIRVRDDKPASECDAWQDQRLINYWHSKQET